MRIRQSISRSIWMLGVLAGAGCLCGFAVRPSIPHLSHGRWTELNIGPFFVDSEGDSGAARELLTNLEQVRWALGGLLESKDLPSVWPVRVVLTNSQKTSAAPHFAFESGMYILACAPGTHVPLDEVAGILLDANTPRLPAEVESGLRQLFGTLQAQGSRVTWGGAPAHPDLAWARIQLFATKFEYSLSFHIFLTALRGGSTLQAAERNAFGKDPAALDQEAAANLAAHDWKAVPTSGRPLDPKRDFGDHSIEDAVAAVYLADAQLAAGGQPGNSPAESAEAAFQSGIQAGGVARALGYEGLAALAELDHQNPQEFFEDAMRAGSKSAPVYVNASRGLDAAQALPLLKKAEQLNPLWAEPVFAEAEFASDPAQKEELLKKAVQLDRRATPYWIELAQVETTQGEATAAQGSWLRAEDSAPDEGERARVHKLRVGSEQERLDAAENANRREREAAHLDDEHAQQAEADRIRAAEAKANAENDQNAGGAAPQNVVPWSDTVPNKKVEGALLQVDCLGSNARLWVKDRTGKTLQLFLRNASQAGVSCGVQNPARRVSLTYAAQADERFQTSGNVLTIKFP